MKLPSILKDPGSTVSVARYFLFRALHLVLLVVLLGVGHCESRTDCTTNLDCVDADAGERCGVCGGQRFYTDGGCYPGQATCRGYQCIERCSDG